MTSDTTKKMQYRRLGASGLKVSEVCLGSWLTFGNATEDQTAEACIDRAYELGINFFDTANVYARGESEKVVGRALQKYPRDSYVVATKVYFPMNDGPMPNNQGLSRKHIMEQCEASLKRLGMDYIDLYQCHRYDTETPLEETLRALDDLVSQGKVLYLGFSQWSAPQIADAVKFQETHNLDRFVSSQPYYNMIGRDLEKAVLPTCEREGIGQIVYSPLAQGVLDGQVQARRTRARRQPRRRPQAKLVSETGRRQTGGSGATGKSAEVDSHRAGIGIDHAPTRPRLVPAPAQRIQRHHRSQQTFASRRQRGRVRRYSGQGHAESH